MKKRDQNAKEEKKKTTEGGRPQREKKFREEEVERSSFNYRGIGKRAGWAHYLQLQKGGEKGGGGKKPDLPGGNTSRNRVMGERRGNDFKEGKRGTRRRAGQSIVLGGRRS